jgi:hypothetical protein
MNELINMVLAGLILMFWILSNMYKKPILNKMMNYYEDDVSGRNISNFFICLMLILAFILGLRST